MFRHVLLRIFLALLVFGGLAAGGAALYRAGWEQGYQAAALTAAAGADGARVAPMPYAFAPYYGYGFGHPGFFNPFGFLFGIGGFVLFLFVVGGIMRFAFWGRRRAWGPYGWHDTPPAQQPPQPETGEKKDQ